MSFVWNGFRVPVLIQSYDHNTFKTCQTWPRLGKSKPSAKIKFRAEMELTLSLSQDVCSPYCATVTVKTSVFCAIKIRLKEENFKWES